MILDGSKGTIRLNPTPEKMTQLREAQVRHEKQRKEDLAHALEPATTTDGRSYSKWPRTIGGLKDAAASQGIGRRRGWFAPLGVLVHGALFGSQRRRAIRRV